MKTSTATLPEVETTVAVYLSPEDLSVLRELGPVDSQIDVAVKVRLKAFNGDFIRACATGGDGESGESMYRWAPASDLARYAGSGRDTLTLVRAAVRSYLNKLGIKRAKVKPLPPPKKPEPLEILFNRGDLDRLYEMGKPRERLAEAVRQHKSTPQDCMGGELRRDDSSCIIKWDVPTDLEPRFKFTHAIEASELVRAALRAYFASEGRKSKIQGAGIRS